MPPQPPKWSSRTTQLVQAAFDEDLGDAGDITSALLAQPDELVTARLVARRSGVLSGLGLLPLLQHVFAAHQRAVIEFSAAPDAVGDVLADGAHLEAGQVIGALRGPRAALLTFERTCLNFLGRMSGVATLTARFAAAAAPARVFDTRKTLPGWRELDKYAVLCGGGFNHRHGLYDAVLIKDNHIAGITAAQLEACLGVALKRIRTSPAFVEVEVDSLAQFDAVCRVTGVDVILLDNFKPDAMTEAVRRRDRAGLRGKVELEASGGVTLENIGAIAQTGVDRIAVGALTHSAASLDIGLDL